MSVVEIVSRSCLPVFCDDPALKCDFTIQKPYKMLSRAGLHAAFRHLPPNAVSDGWEGFRDSFPDSSGYLILSGVGFNSDKTIALVTSNTGTATCAAVLDITFSKNVMDTGRSASPKGSHLR